MIFSSAETKIERAKELIQEIEVLLQNNPAYSYCLETNTSTGQRATFAKKDQKALDKVVLRCGDVLHNLRSALDHAYWDAVSPYVTDESKRGAIQFPFSKNVDNLKSTIKSRLAHKVSQDFYDAIVSVKPYASIGGNQILHLVHTINIVDKHKFPVPVGNFTKISSSQIISQVPDFPRGLVDGRFGENRRDVVWQSRHFDNKDIGEVIPPTLNLFHKRLNVPVTLMFSIREYDYYEPVVNTLYSMSDEISRILSVMRNGLPK